jgi:predicted O-methyltransferase YrrM
MTVLMHLAAWTVGLAAAQTQTTDAERRCLARHARGARRLVELGVWHGVTTTLLRSVMAPDGALWAVDPFQPGRLWFSAQRLIARREVARHRNGSVHWLRTDAVAAATRYRESGEPPLDFVFIDADHSYEAVVADWRAWSDLVGPGGVVCLHDSRSTETRSIDDAGSVAATRDAVLTDDRFDLVDTVDSLTVVRRRSV